MAGNWKMNLDHLQATHLVQKLDWTLQDAKHDFGAVEVAVCRRSPTCARCRRWSRATSSTLKYGAQDISLHDEGAYTGEVSGPMLSKLGCTYVVIGHSERREYHDETDELLNAKVEGRLQARPHPDPVLR